jgi:cytochrome P450
MDDNSYDALASRIIARRKGVIDSPASDVAGALGRFVKRVIALPLGIAMGVIAGPICVPILLVLQGALWKRIALALAAPLGAPVFGAWVGYRYASRGSLDPLPLLAAIAHRFVPVIAFPKALTHHVSGLAIATTYDDVKLVLQRNDVFQVNGYDARMRAASGPFILGMDPGPEYDKEQAIAARAVGRDVAPLRALAVSLSRALVEKAYERSRTIDVVTELAHAVQVAVVDRFYGIPNTRDDRLIPWLETMSFYLFNLWVGGPYRAAASEAGHELAAHIRRVVRDRAEALDRGGSAKDDVIGRMIAALRESGGSKPQENEDFMVRTMSGLVSGATIATIGLFVGAVDRLLDLPGDERAALRKAAQIDDDPTVKRFLLEAARFSAYPPTLYRHTLTPFVFHAGTKHEAKSDRGAWVLTLPIFANYDARVFPNPEHFNPMREYPEGQGPLLFGWSQHRCLGEHMAILLMMEMLKALFAKGVERLPGPDGKTRNGEPGVIPDGDYPARLVVRFE